MNKRDYTSAYNKRRYKGYAFRLDKDSDADLISHLDTVSSFTSYMRGLIARDMMKRKSRKVKQPEVIHSDVKVNITKYPFELIYGYKSVGYVRDPESAIVMMDNYLKAHPEANIRMFRICRRMRTETGEIYAYEIK